MDEERTEEEDKEAVVTSAWQACIATSPTLSYYFRTEPARWKGVCVCVCVCVSVCDAQLEVGGDSGNLDRKRRSNYPLIIQRNDAPYDVPFSVKGTF